MSKLGKYFAKKLGDILPQPSAEKLHKAYTSVCMAGRKIPLLPIWGVGAKNTDPSKGFVDLKNIFNNYYKKNSTFAAEIPEGHELLRTMYFALHPETGAPLQGDLTLKSGQNVELSAFAYILRNSATKEVFYFFKGTVPRTKEYLASTGDNTGFNNDDVMPADRLIKGMPGDVKASNARWMLARVYYVDEAGNKKVLVESMVDQMEDSAQPDFMKAQKGFKFILAAHSVGTTELAIMYTILGLAEVQPESALALCLGPYRVYSKATVEYMMKYAPGPWLNVINGSDFIPLASDIRGTFGTAYFTRPEITNEVYQKWIKDNPWDLPGQNYGFESRHGVGWKPDANHTLPTYGTAFNLQNFNFIERLVPGITGLLQFKAESGKDILALQPLSHKVMDDIAEWIVDYRGYWYSQFS